MLSGSAKTCFLVVFGFFLLVGVLLWTSTFSTQPIPVDNSKTGVYKALAQVTFQSFKNGDLQTAATLGQILDRTWDQVETDGEHQLNKTNPVLFQNIDKARTAFTAPLIHYDQQRTDSSAIDSAYKAFLDQLNAADADTSPETVTSPRSTHE